MEQEAEALSHYFTDGIKFDQSESVQIGSREVSPREESSDSILSSPKRDQHYYARRFVEIYDGLTDPSLDNDKDHSHLWKDLHTLGQDFVENAKIFAMTIIAERHLNDEAKTIKPIKIGGVAGGKKFLWNGILFKLPTDQLINGRYLYGGEAADDEKAAKAAMIEATSANFVGTYDPDILATFTTVVRYAGALVYATAFLPINNSTLLYGSADGGTTVVNIDPKLDRKMKAMGKGFNLKLHHINEKEMATCGDIEVHRCIINCKKYFLIDPARVFPPERAESIGNNQSVYWEKLQPNFVGSYNQPLCSDAFTGFQCAEEIKENNSAVLNATAHLHDKTIPHYVKKLFNERVINELLSSTSPFHVLFSLGTPNLVRQNSLISHMHSHGLNVRHLGEVAKRLERKRNCTDRVLEMKNYVYNTMISRVIKNHANRKLKHAESFTEYKDIITDIMNNITTPDVRKNKILDRNGALIDQRRNSAIAFHRCTKKSIKAFS